VNPIHPSLAPLARCAKTKDWRELDGTLGAALRNPAWLRPEHRVGDSTAYMRHVLYVDPDGDFVITAITWLPGQASPIHGHLVWCAYGVAEGILTEEQFTPSLEVKKSVAYRAGELAERDLEKTVVHRVSNRGAAPLVSLHLYGVAAERLTTGINRRY
jgi:predicted metal-dependent enzyme (double-stranded beta helix superfamily)